ncbi:Flagellar biosynthesis protein FlhB [Candidatus Rhodobacter oscarellae]|uniref:Flagellar biosynthesis protein FlhB n=1 Tax=Candidatus Rhodobacter oscarellae TaxID=1675527 RepID=A0A0J9EBG1_9RHOB|nr:flagellar type III secretion system protein FlhB [Candidatus Rhodobacter lobularis]KMW59034.1 Flagellar biosynthesis protein FlhB [Candidatus Rhodobacter lobularis]
MSQGDEDTEKQYEPTQKKLDDARRKGDIPKSNDIMTAAAYGGLLLSILAIGATTMTQVGGVLANLLGRSDQFAEIWFAEGAYPLSGVLAGMLGRPLAIWFAVPAVAVLAAILAQRAFVVAPSKLEPKLSRISVISNAKNKFGRSGLFEFFKSFLKLVIYSLILGYFLYWKLDEVVSVVSFNPRAVLQLMLDLTVEFLAIVLVIAAVIGGIDYVFQAQEHTRKNRMSRKDLTDEAKQSEGDPHMKQERRQRAYEIAMNTMLADVPEADVVVVNPTHYAVALKWSRAPGTAPECVAKGVDQVAAKIREIAAESAVPIHRDPPTARALYASVDIGQEIPVAHYKAVAAAIQFAERVRKQAKASLQ